MGTGAGVCSQFGYKLESVFGTPVTVDTFHRHVSVGGNGLDPVRVLDEGLGGCVLVPQADRFTEQASAVMREVELNASARKLGQILKVMLASAASPTQLGATAIYRQIHSNGETAGKSLTVQFGFPEHTVTATNRPHTIRGAKIMRWELAQALNDILKLRFTLLGVAEATATALASAAYTAAETYGFKNFSAKIGGTPTFGSGLWSIADGAQILGCRGATVRGSLALREDPFFSGGAGVMSEQLANGFQAYDGDLDTEFHSRTQLYDVFAANTTTALQFTWTGTDADGGNNVKLDAIMPFCKLTSPGGNPSVSGPGALGARTGFRVFGDPSSLTNPAIQLVYDSRDTAL